MNRYKAIDRSGAIVQAGKAQPIMPANTARVGAWIQNNGTTDLWINELGPAAPNPPSMRLPPGAFYEMHNEGVPMTEISIFGAVATPKPGEVVAQIFSAREW